MRLQPQRALELTFGRYDMEAIWGGQRADVWYAKAEYQRRFGSWGEVRAVDFLKRVKDDIPDGVFRFGDVANFDIFNPRATIETFVEDELLMRDSAVNTAFVDFAFRGCATSLSVPISSSKSTNSSVPIAATMRFSSGLRCCEQITAGVWAG